MRRLVLSVILAILASVAGQPEGGLPGPSTASAATKKKPSRKKAVAKRPRHRRHGRAPAPVPALTRDGLPNVQAAAAVVVDLDSGEELYAKNPDAVRRIASVGKLVVALAVRDNGLPLDGQTTITPEDRKYARGGSRSRLLEGKAFNNQDILRAMLIASDNRAVTAIGRAAGLTPAALVKAMNGVAHRLGLRHTEFTDPTGLRGNVSTPRDLVVVLKSVLADPVLAQIVGTHEAVVRSTNQPGYAVQYFNTNHSLRAGQYPVLGGKTGYTDEARYCLAIAATMDDRRVGMVFLGAEGELTRFADFKRVADWIAAGGPGKSAHNRKHAGGVGASFDPPQAIVPKI